MLSQVQVYGAKFFSTVDLQSAFFLIPLDSINTEITSFFADCGNNTRSWGKNLTGRYRYERLVMGCQTSSSVLNKTMEITLRCLPFGKIYCDDLLITSKPQANLFGHLRTVFQRIWRFGIKLAADECKLFQQHIEFLAYKTDKEGIRPDKDKIKIVKDMLPPQTVKEIRQTLHFFNFYKIFVPNYLFHSNKLTSLTRKNSKWKGGILSPESQERFQQLKMALLKAPTLNNPDLSKSLHLLTNASKGTQEISDMIGWALVQEGRVERQWNPISFGSRVLTKSEQNFL